MNQTSTSHYSKIFGVIVTWQPGYVEPCCGPVMSRFSPLYTLINALFNSLFDIHPPTPSFCPKWSHLTKPYAKNECIASFWYQMTSSCRLAQPVRCIFIAVSSRYSVSDILRSSNDATFQSRTVPQTLPWRLDALRTEDVSASLTVIDPQRVPPLY